MKAKFLPVLLCAGLVGAPALAQDPYLQPDDTWITLNGTVQSVSPDKFELDYGGGVVTVEMTDGDRDADAYQLLRGDKVSVTGLIDDDFFETTSIDASSVYVDNINTWFFADPTEEGVATITTPVVTDYTVLQGTVTKVNGEEFTLNTGARQVTVEVDEMATDPLDKEGFRQVTVGDRVSVTGQIDTDFFEGRVLEADSLVELSGYGA